MNVVCKCGYQGDEMVQYETEVPSRALVRWSGSSYFNHVEWIKSCSKTLIWACPKCGKTLVRQLGGRSYNGTEQEAMRKRLWHNSRLNETYLKAQKLPPGKYEARIVSMRKVRNKPLLHCVLQLTNNVVIKETL